jgi:hypothetical protein
MRTTDAIARGIQRGNIIVMGLYAAAAAVLAPRFQSWPRDLSSVASRASMDTFVGRTMLEHPALVWVAIPVTLLVTNTLAIAVGDRGNLFRPTARVSTVPSDVRGVRARAFAWIGCAMTAFTIFVSVLFYAGWDAVARRDPNVFWHGITTGAAILTPIVAFFIGLAAWNVYRAFQLARESLR